MKLFFRAFLFAFLALCLSVSDLHETAQAQGSSSKKTIKIGVAGPFTGSGAAFGKMIRMGSELAAGQINASGGIDGRKIELVFGDDQAKPEQAKLVAKKLAEDRDIVLVVGHFNSDCSNAGKPTYKRERVVEFSPGSTNVAVCKGSDWTFRNLYKDDYQGTFLARYMKNVLKYGSVAVFYASSDYGIGLKSAFVDEAKKQELRIVGEASYVKERTMDYSTDLDKLMSKKPDAIFIAGVYNEAAAIVKQARSKGLKVPFLGGDGLMSPGFTEIAGDAAEGTYITTPFMFGDDLSPVAENFLDEFEKKYETTPDTWAALTYDAVMMAMEAIREVGPDREKIRENFARRTAPEKGFNGVTGITYFDENGDCLKPAYVAIVKNGEFVPADKQMLD